jgi:hypothetical protein
MQTLLQLNYLGVAPHRKHRFLYCCVYIHCCTDVFTAPLRSNKRCDEHIKRCSSIFARVHFRRSMFTEPLPSNELFRVAGIMSQYDLGLMHIMSSG